MKSSSAEAPPADPVDLLVIGGGVNGCGIARDAAGRGLSVCLCEQGDLGQATSSASTKLLHGGLRYLEQYDFRLVREALIEREALLAAMPHIAWPLRFVLPHHQGLRPAWMLRAGLFLYDHLGGRSRLPGSRRIDLREHVAGRPLKDAYQTGFEYSDGWVDDARLVVLNARDAAARGAQILTRTRLLDAERRDGVWRARLLDRSHGCERIIRAKGLVNAGGPWVDQILTGALRQNSADRIRLVRGAHVVTRRLFAHDHAYIFQNADGRILFAIPYEQDFTLLGTTDVDHDGDPGSAVCTAAEAAYICAAVSEYLAAPVTPDDVVWSFAGVRPLHDDGEGVAAKVSRDYALRLTDENGAAPLLSVFGGKITTFRKLAESAMARLKPYYPSAGGPWTRGAALPGGDFAMGGAEALAEALRADHPFLTEAWARRLVRAYGAQAEAMLGGARRAEDLGRRFGADLTEREAEWLVTREFATTAEDMLWRRSKLGLRFSKEQTAALAEWCETRAEKAA